jgi:hypothetical protein
MKTSYQPTTTSNQRADETTLAVYERHTAGRAAIEGFIQAIYAKRYDAHVPGFAPVLLAIHSADGSILAAVGYRSAASERLFLENYLAQPIERALWGPNAQPERRQNLVEVAHLVAIQPGAGRRMMVELRKWLQALHTEWVVSTVTRELRHLFIRMGIAPQALGVALPESLGTHAHCWGNYHAHDPVVLGIALRQTVHLCPKLVAGA